MFDKIDSKDISVVIQGAIDLKITKKCLQSIRKHLPNAEIILSTWAGSKIDDLEYDKLVLNEDPGGIRLRNLRDLTSVDNMNRQLISFKNGLNAVKRKYTLKLRTDCYLSNSNFLKYWNTFPIRNEKYAFFSHRVMIISSCCIEIYRKTLLPSLFHVSDFSFFGLTCDLNDYIQKTQLYTPSTFEFSFVFPLKYCSFVPEQYFCTEWVKRHINEFNMSNSDDINLEKMTLSNNIIYNNFIVIHASMFGLKSYKHNFKFMNDFSYPCITYDLFQRRYKELCDSNYKINHKYKYKYKMLKNLNYNLYPLKFLIKKSFCFFKSFFSLIKYSFLYFCS